MPTRSILGDNIGHVINFVAIVVAAVFFITEIKAQTGLISQRLGMHISLPAHDSMLTESHRMAIQMTQLTSIVAQLEGDMERIETRMTILEDDAE